MADQKDRGWRKALYCALSDGTSIKVKTKLNPKLRKREEKDDLSLFDLFNENT